MPPPDPAVPPPPPAPTPPAPAMPALPAPLSPLLPAVPPIPAAAPPMPAPDPPSEPPAPAVDPPAPPMPAIGTVPAVPPVAPPTPVPAVPAVPPVVCAPPTPAPPPAAPAPPVPPPVLSAGSPLHAGEAASASASNAERPTGDASVDEEMIRELFVMRVTKRKASSCPCNRTPYFEVARKSFRLCGAFSHVDGEKSFSGTKTNRELRASRRRFRATPSFGSLGKARKTALPVLTTLSSKSHSPAINSSSRGPSRFISRIRRGSEIVSGLERNR